MNRTDQMEREKEKEKEGRGRGAKSERGIERSAYRTDERMRESGIRNCIALEKIAFPLIISSHG